MMEETFNFALSEEEARIAAIYPLGLIGDPEYPPEWMSEFVEWCTDGTEAIIDQLPEIRPLFEENDDPAAWAHAFFNKNRNGFIVQWECCVHHYLKDSPIHQSGWGFFQFGWIYVDAVEKIGPAVLEIARAQHAREMAKAGAA